MWNMVISEYGNSDYEITDYNNLRKKYGKKLNREIYSTGGDRDLKQIKYKNKNNLYIGNLRILSGEKKDIVLKKLEKKLLKRSMRGSLLFDEIKKNYEFGINPINNYINLNKKKYALNWFLLSRSSKYFFYIKSFILILGTNFF